MLPNVTVVVGGFVRKASALLMTVLIHAFPPPLATLSFAANKCPPKQPIASAGLLLLQFMALKTLVTSVVVLTE